MSENSRAEVPMAAPEEFVRGAYASVDEAIAGELGRLRREDGVAPSCERGCCHCCRFHITVNLAEAHALAQYVKREFSTEQVRDLRSRTQKWHDWDNSRLGRQPSARIDAPTDLSGYEPCCPLLVDGGCSAYPARPVVCRVHFVSSQPRFCRAANDPDSTEAAPVALKSVVTAANPFSAAIRDRIEAAGLDYSRSIMLLPHWLAIEMGWDFAISP